MSVFGVAILGIAIFVSVFRVTIFVSVLGVTVLGIAVGTAVGFLLGLLDGFGGLLGLGSLEIFSLVY